ncbi:gluconate 2-dehydrogenase, flavoprotein subunit [Klebsiella pneumoniae]|nr:gluconate 2-dehydrogenase, flavoprotein subunit [Klebsiella pneumoniae]
MEQPADLVIIGAFQFHNVHLMLLSGIGKPYNPETGEGVVGRNFAYQNMTTIKAIFDKDTYTNPFIGAGRQRRRRRRLQRRQLRPRRGGLCRRFAVLGQPGRDPSPSPGFPVPPGTPAWGSKWKAAVADTYTHHLSMDAHGAHQSYRQNYLDLDPNYKNVFGQPLLRMTFDWQENDIKMAQFMFDKMAPIAKAMKPKYILGSPKNANSHFDTTTYQTTHMNGGAVMGEDPKTSAVNRYLQSWDVHNVFVIGASAFPQGLGYNPTGTVAALAYWSAKAIREQYLKNPGPLVQA